MKAFVFLLCLSLCLALHRPISDEQEYNDQSDSEKEPYDEYASRENDDTSEVYQLSEDVMVGDDPALNNADVNGSSDEDQDVAFLADDTQSNGISSVDREQNRSERLLDNILDTDSQEELRQTIDPSTCVVEGLWYNELGSELLLRQELDGNLTGEFRTAVEIECGNAGSSHSKVRGTVTGRLITFHALWSSGNAITTWSGQCHRACDLGFANYKQTERIILHTSWIMTSLTDSCDDSWQQQRFGQNIFSRKPIKKAGPRKSNGIHTPDRSDCDVTGSDRVI